MNMSRNNTGNTTHVMSKTTRLLSALMLLCSSCLVMATPEEDVRKGIEAFNRGDVVGAMDYYRQAAEIGYAPAQAKLGYLLDLSELNEEAIKWYTKAAEQGDPEGQYLLSGKYAAADEGVEQDYAKAAELLNSSAESGHINAMHSLATAYERGALGLPTDPKKAIYWIEQAAQLNDRWAIQRLIKAYRWGEFGLPLDETKAQLWESRLPPVESK